jgi:hypothetical protein
MSATKSQDWTEYWAISIKLHISATDEIFFFVALRPNAGQGLLIHEVSRPHTTTRHSRQDYPGWVIGSSQRPLPDNTQHSQQTNIYAPAGFEPTLLTGERPQTNVLDRAATGIGNWQISSTKKPHN